MKCDQNPTHFISLNEINLNSDFLPEIEHCDKKSSRFVFHLCTRGQKCFHSDEISLTVFFFRLDKTQTYLSSNSSMHDQILTCPCGLEALWIGPDCSPLANVVHWAPREHQRPIPLVVGDRRRFEMAVFAGHCASIMDQMKVLRSFAYACASPQIVIYLGERPFVIVPPILEVLSSRS